MFTKSFRIQVVVATLAVASFASCTKDDPAISPENQGISKFRSGISYSSFTDSTAYKANFIDSNGDTTVELSEGNDRFNMFKAIDVYNKSANPVGSTTILDSTVLRNMFSNSGSPFSGTYSYLNTSAVQIKNKTAGSSANSEAIRSKMESFFSKIAISSQSVSQSASEGQAGKLINGTSGYLVDENGVEWAQVIAKSLIGAYQLDYIGNTLLAEPSLSADNSKVMDGKKYSALEYNWDQAYANLTIKSVFLGASTTTSNGGESFIGTYVWEYNKDGYKKIHPAFLKGRAAIVNGDKTTLSEQANLIRREFEKAIASAAVGYLQKVKDNATNDAIRAHAYGEGVGFMYSLRFCKMNSADEAFSDGLLSDVEFNSTGIWQLTSAELDGAITKIKTKFGL